MVRRAPWSALLALAALLVVAAPALAGGWAVVTLDALPTAIRADQSISLGFTVRQHGVTPVDVHTWKGSDMPVFTATNTATDETIRFDARKEGAVGHYVVDVTFPGEGAWDVEIKPGWFEGTALGTFTVAPAASTTSSVGAWVVQPAMLRVAGGGLVLAAFGLALIRRQNKPVRQTPALSTR